MLLRMRRVHIFLLTTILFSCFGNAERDNPLDPKSENYENYGQVRGLVYTYYAPYQPLSNVTITLLPGSQTTTSDLSGAFLFTEVPPGNYLIFTDLENYASDSVQVQINSGETKQVQFNLDGLPELQQIKLNTGVINLWWPPEPSQLLECEVDVSDPDGYQDIQSVLFSIPGIDFADTLQITTTLGVFQNKFYSHDLLVNSIHELVGYPVYIDIQDNVGPRQQFGPHLLVRVIDEETLIVSPQGKVLLGSLPTFEWNPVVLPYPFTFSIDIFRIIDQGYDSKVLTISEISSGDTQYTVQSPLAEGSYYWTISIVDQYGNWNRSKPATFDVGA